MEYLLKKISTAMNEEWDGKLLDDLISQDATVQEEGMSVWTFLELMNAGRLLKVTSAEAFSVALDEVFLEMYHNVLKRVSVCGRMKGGGKKPMKFMKLPMKLQDGGF